MYLALCFLCFWKRIRLGNCRSKVVSYDETPSSHLTRRWYNTSMRMGIVVVAIVFVVTCEGGTFATSYVAALLGTPERQRIWARMSAPWFLSLCDFGFCDRLAIGSLWSSGKHSSLGRQLWRLLFFPFVNTLYYSSISICFLAKLFYFAVNTVHQACTA
jgi:hypothetical protein